MSTNGTIPAGVLDVILRRLDALEATRRASGEQLSPNYLNVDQQGRVGAVFTSVVNALGFVLPAAGSASSPGPPNRIQWQRVDGAYVASLIGWDNGVGANGLALQTPGTLELDGSAIALDADVSASGDVTAAGTVSASADVVAGGTVQGGFVNSTGDVDASANVVAGGTVQGGYVVSTGDVHANNDLTADQSVIASVNISAGGDVSANTMHVPPGSVLGWNGQYSTGNQTLAAGATVDVNVSDGRWTLGGGAYAYWTLVGYILGTASFAWGVTAFTGGGVTVRLRNVGTVGATGAWYGYMVGAASPV